MKKITFEAIERLIGHATGEFRTVCPICGPSRSTPKKRKLPVLKIWRDRSDFASFACGHCEACGYAVRDGAAKVSREDHARLRAKAVAAAKQSNNERIAKVRWLWSRRLPIVGTVAETYLRHARGYGGPLPGTLGFLPPRGVHAPAMIAAFGLAREIEPGVLAIADDAVHGVHLTRLRPDGFGKAGTESDKIMIGSSLGCPIVLAPPNDLLGLAITEGIEDALSAHETPGSAPGLPEVRRACPLSPFRYRPT